MIKDKTIAACVCGRDKHAVIKRTAKQRVLTWMMTIVVVVGPVPLLLGLLDSEDIFDVGGLLVIGLIAYAVVGVSVKTLKYAKKQHKLVCSLRRAFYDIV